MNKTMPAIFIGHGNPMNALADNDFTRAWFACGGALPRPSAVLSVPTPDHYLPLLYIIALQNKDEPVSYPVEGFDGGTVSMLAVRIG